MGRLNGASVVSTILTVGLVVQRTETRDAGVTSVCSGAQLSDGSNRDCCRGTKCRHVSLGLK